MNDVTKQALSKVPAVTLGFWVIKILATTLGETGGDTVTMTLNWGYLAGVTLFGGVLVALVVAQISAKRFYWILYWATIVASTTFGTTLADFADRSLGIGYAGGSLLPGVLSVGHARAVANGLSPADRFRFCGRTLGPGAQLGFAANGRDHILSS